MSYREAYTNVDYRLAEESLKLQKEQRRLSVCSDIYVQPEESLYEPVRGSGKEEPTLQWGSDPLIRGYSGGNLQRDCKEPGRGSGKAKYEQPWRSDRSIRGRHQRCTPLIAALVVGLMVTLFLILFSCGLAKYTAMESERESWHKEKKRAETLGSFLIYNEAQNKCAEVQQSNSSSSNIYITASSCSLTSISQFFRWMSRARLLNVKAELCLGASEILRSRIAVKLLPCDSKGALSWVCTNETLLGPYKQQLYFNYGNALNGRVIFYEGTGIWSRWKILEIDGGLQEGGVCGQLFA